MKKVIFLTGSTDGIGKLAAIQLANEGHTLILHGRNRDKLNRVISDVSSTSSNQNISGYVADFADLKEVQQIVVDVKKNIPKIDVLINNAGIFKSPHPNSVQGLDIRFSVNYFAPYLLTSGLMPLLKKSDEPRLINLSSAAQASVSPAVLSGSTQTSAQSAYAQSKLALLQWSFYLAQKETDISVIALNPGSLLDTNMVREAYGRSWSSADKGASIIFELATSPKFKGMTKKYFDNDRGSFGPAHPDASNETANHDLILQTDLIIKEKLHE